MAGFHGHATGHTGGSGMYPGMPNLNLLPAEYDLALQHQHQQHGQQQGYDFQADLDLFTNTQFFDFDMGEGPDTASPTSDENTQWAVNNNGGSNNRTNNANPNGANGVQAGSAEFLNGGDLQQVHNYFTNQGPSSASSSRHPSTFQTPSLPSNQLFDASSSHSPVPPTSANNQAGEKRKSEAAADSTSGTTTPAPASLEEASRLAAEEDKRRRNTAASARFRVKKKQREQALEKSAKDMSDRVNYLEQRVNSLEMENKLLKDLITEKSGPDVNIAELTKKMAGAKDAAANGQANLADLDNASSEKGKRELKIERADQKQHR